MEIDITFPEGASVILAGYAGEFDIPILVELENAPEIISVGCEVHGPDGTLIAVLPDLTIPPYRWTWTAQKVENGSYRIMILVIDIDGKEYTRSRLMEVRTQYHLDFINHTLFPATIFINDQTVACDSNDVARDILAFTGANTISINIQDNPPFPYFDEDVIEISDNSRLELFQSLSGDSFYYLVSP